MRRLIAHGSYFDMLQFIRDKGKQTKKDESENRTPSSVPGVWETVRFFPLSAPPKGGSQLLSTY